MKHSIRLTESNLVHLVPYINNNILSNRSKWALVGGYVRDTLISNLIDKKIYSPDIDIAVFGKIPELKQNEEIIEINKNTFGGLKVKTRKYGYIDIWSIDNIQDNIVEKSVWENYLDKIDFSINSIVFAYPELKLFLHNDWFNSFNNRLVSKLYQSSPMPDIQLVRAIALTINLSSKTGRIFSTNKEIKKELSRLLIYGDEATYNKLIDYASNKISKNRWSQNVLSELTEIKVSDESFV